jgi:hypothetical protein
MSGIFALSLFITNPIFSGIFALSLFIAFVSSKVELIVWIADGLRHYLFAPVAASRLEQPRVRFGDDPIGDRCETPVADRYVFCLAVTGYKCREIDHYFGSHLLSPLCILLD